MSPGACRRLGVLAQTERQKQGLAQLESSDHERNETLGLRAIGLVTSHRFGEHLFLIYGLVNGRNSDNNHRNNKPRIEAQLESQQHGQVSGVDGMPNIPIYTLVHQHVILLHQPRFDIGPIIAKLQAGENRDQKSEGEKNRTSDMRNQGFITDRQYLRKQKLSK